MKISSDDYFGEKINHADVTQERITNAIALLEKVNALLAEYAAAGHRLENNPHTGTLISGKTEGGFRLSTSATGKPTSAHREGRAVDIFDPANKLDDWLTRDILVRFYLYREAAPFTKGWCHLTDRPPKSKNRSFIP